MIHNFKHTRALKKRIKINLLLLIITGITFYNDGHCTTKNNPALLQAPVEQVSSTREQVCLNGLWYFCPALDLKENPSEKEWGTIWVPGAWAADAWWVDVPGISEKGNGKRWEKNLQNINKAWYQRDIFIPENWTGSKISLEFNRIATDGIVFIDNNMVDTIHWPWGTVDLSNHVKPGKTHSLKVMVLATPSPGKYFRFMGTANAMVTQEEEVLHSKGITDEVYLKNYPGGIKIEDVFARTSFRKKKITLEIEIDNLPKDIPIQLQVEVKNDKGLVERTLRGEFTPGTIDNQTFELSTSWLNPKLWEPDAPHLYKAHVKVTANDHTDEYVQEFGFREFWIEGKSFYLNGIKINLKPGSNPFGGGMTELIDAGFESLKSKGYNFLEIWPHDFTRRGMIEYNRQLSKRASKKGFLIAAPVPPSTTFIMGDNWQYIWNEKGMKEAYEKKMLPYLKKIRNEPGVVMYTLNPNFFGHEDDQNPRVIGTRGWVKEDPAWQQKGVAGSESINIIKKHDPTRPMFNHHGAYVGDVHTINMYLCLLPLQEREEWLSHYAKFGQVPFMAVEFGTPLECTFLRGRAPFGENIRTEPLFTEFAASYFGNDAYYSETGAYRKQIRDSFIMDQEYKIWQGNDINERLPSHQALQSLFVQNTWRSWRTYGISGGMRPWMDAHGWQISKKGHQKEKVCDFIPGKKGTYFEKASLAKIHYLDTPYWIELPSAKHFIKNNNEILAYIGGNQKNFAEKGHNFKVGEVLNKQVIIINDSREAKKFSFIVTFKSGNKIIDTSIGEGIIQPAMVKKIPVQTSLPRSIGDLKQQGEIILEAEVGHELQVDTFRFSLFNKPIVENKSVICYDPLGLTSSMLDQLGYNVKHWRGEMDAPELVVGREALSSGYKIPGNLEEYVQNGGKLLIMAQSPEYLENQFGFRVSKYVSRYVFPVNINHLIMEGLEKENLRNWRGNGTLIEAYPDYLNQPIKEGRYGVPYYGWHWGNTGSVASTAIEKPHVSGWRPILECEFDLAYTPLMELNHGKGIIIMNTLDLEDNHGVDPVADLLTSNLIKYLKKARGTKSRGVLYAGSETGRKVLDLIKVPYEIARESIDPANLLIYEPGNNLFTEKELEKFVKQGGIIFCLPSSENKGLFGSQYMYKNNFAGSLKVPDWEETKGLSVSDSRWRTYKDAWLISGGCEIGADGLMGKKNMGKGSVFFCQVNPGELQADSLTYFRYTRWRQTRTIAQVLANLGVNLENDNKILSLKELDDKFTLAGNWLASLVDKKHVTISVVSTIEDQGISKMAMEMINSGADHPGLEEVHVPMEMEKYGEKWHSANGEVVFLKSFTLPESYMNQDLILDLGVINDYDYTYFNGKLVGKVEKGFDEVWGYERKYKIPAELVNTGENTIAIRVYDVYGKGGLVGSENEMCIYPANLGKKSPLYHPDYREDFKLGDDPFRYFRW